MTRDELKSEFNKLLKERYDIDIMDLDESTKAVDLSKLNPKLDSIEFLTFLFDVEDSLDISLTEGINVNSDLKEVIDTIYESYKQKHE